MQDKSSSLFKRPLVGWLGDDFTGAAAVMEVLTFSGLPSILYLSQPQSMPQTRGLAGIGIATLARSKTPDWMDATLHDHFRFLDQTGAELIHYKTCSTLDSAPHIGSIGRAIDIGRDLLGKSSVPVVTAAPEMRRYQAFGNLFCSAPDGIHRLDRHPVMAHHPVTPMTEADVARHLSLQTETPVGCIDLEDICNKTADRKLENTPGIWTIDLVSKTQQAEIGRLLWERRKNSRLVAGSQGVEYALVSHLQDAGLLAECPLPRGLCRDDRFAVVSGSASPTSAAQIDWARRNGFATIRLDTPRLCAGDRDAAETEATQQATQALSRNRPVIVYTAEGPNDPSFAAVQDAVGGEMHRANDEIGRSLGRVLRTLVDRMGLRRVAVSGGDTSGRVCEALSIYALTAVSPTIPGAAICRATAKGSMNGLEIALKGGQMGSPDYFGWVRDGGGARP